MYIHAEVAMKCMSELCGNSLSPYLATPWAMQEAKNHLKLTL